MRKTTKNFFVMAFIIIIAAGIFNGGFSRTGLADYAQEKGLNYDHFLVNTLTSSTTTKPFTASLGSCTGTLQEYTRILSDDKWISTGITRQGTGCQDCACSEAGTIPPTVNMADGKLTVAGLQTYREGESCVYDCQPLEYINVAPFYTKFDWSGKDTIIKLKASTDVECSEGRYGTVLVGNVEIPITTEDNLLEIKWSKINPRTFAVFRTGDLIQESTVPYTQSIITCPDYVCESWSAIKTGCDPSVKDKYDYALAPQFSYDKTIGGIGSYDLFTAEAGKGVLINDIQATVTSRAYYQSGNKYCGKTSYTITLYYLDGTTATLSGQSSCDWGAYCVGDSLTYTNKMSNPYPDKLVKRIASVSTAATPQRVQISCLPGTGSAAYSVSVSSGELANYAHIQQQKCSGNYGTIYRNRICDPTLTLAPDDNDLCHTLTKNITTQIGFIPEKKCSVADYVHSGTLSVEYIRYALPFNCDTEPGEVKVFEVFNSGTITLDSSTYPIVKFCREFKAEILDMATNAYTVDDSDEIYEGLAQGKTLTIPSGQMWALHYIATSTGRSCSASEELDVAAGSCGPAVGFAERLAILQGQVSEQQRQISALEQLITERAELLNSLNLTVSQQASQIEDFNMTIAQQGRLISQLDISVQQQTALIEELNLNLAEKIVLVKNLNANIDTQSQIIDGLNLNLAQKALMINNLTDNIASQASIINNLNLNLAEKAALIGQLTSSNERQAELIREMNLEFSEQGAILQQLNLKVTDDAALILQLTDRTDEQAQIIKGMQLKISEDATLIKSMNLSLEQQANIITSLKLTLAEDAQLINSMKLNLTEQSRIIDALKLNNEQQAQLIIDMQLSLQNQADLVKSLKQNTFEQARLIDALNSQARYTNAQLAELIARLGYSKAQNEELVSKLSMSEQEKKNLLELIAQIKLTGATTIIRIQGIVDWFNETWSTTLGKIELSAAGLVIIYLGYSYYKARWGKGRRRRR
jgi:hypothetical protein